MGSHILGVALRLVFMVAILLFTVLPDEVRAHPGEDAAHAHSADHAADPTDHHGKKTNPLHCHPDLDCFVTAVFLAASKATPPDSWEAQPYRFSRHDSDDWIGAYEPPPPRRLS
jgi:hypothetical protein